MTTPEVQPQMPPESNQIVCLSCGKMNSPGLTNCDQCGKPLEGARKRSGCLSAYLILGFIGIPILIIFLLVAGGMSLGYDSGLLGITIILLLAQLVAYVFLWRWKKWAAYLIGALIVINLIINLAMGVSGAQTLLSAVVGGGIFYWLMKKNWHFFE